MIKIRFRIAYPNELYHHGIKGQHWGVRNGPPYPLDSKTSAKIKRGDNEKVRFSSKEYRDMRSGKKKTTEKDRAGTSHYAGFGERFMGDTDSTYRKRDENGNIKTISVIEGSQAGYILKNDPDAYRVKQKGITSSDLFACNGTDYAKSDDYITDGVYIMRGKSIEPFVVPLNVDVFDEALKNIVYASK